MQHIETFRIEAGSLNNAPRQPSWRQRLCRVARDNAIAVGIAGLAGIFEGSVLGMIVSNIGSDSFGVAGIIIGGICGGGCGIGAMLYTSDFDNKYGFSIDVGTGMGVLGGIVGGIIGRILH